MQVCLYGASSNVLAQGYLDAAYDAGKLLAQHGHTLVYGGGAQGVMGAAARGAHENSGRVIGVAPSFFHVDGILYDQCDEFIYTETMRERKGIMDEKAEGFLLAPGGIGSFEEFFEILTLKQLGRDDRAIVLLNTLGAFDAMLRMLEELAERRFMSKNCLELYFVADTPEQAMEYLAGYVAQKGSIRRLEDYNK